MSASKDWGTKKCQRLYSQESHGDLRLADGLYDSSLKFCAECTTKNLDEDLDREGAIYNQTTLSNLVEVQKRPIVDRTHYGDAIDESCPFCIFFVHAKLYATYNVAFATEWLWPKCEKSVVGLYKPGLMSKEGRLLATITAPPNQESGDGLIYGRRIHSGEIDFQLLKNWVSRCLEDHACGRALEQPNPPEFRLIDCKTRSLLPSGETKKLLADQTSRAVQYVTLSYVWGKSGVNYTEPMKFEEWSSNTSLPGVLPKVIRDAITVVKKLGYQYLWVDRFCIPQGQDVQSLEVRKNNILQMGLIYAASIFTIIAAAGDGPEDGLAGVSSDSYRRIPQPAIKLSDRLVVGVANPNLDIPVSVWNTRGWTFQEAGLSTRRIAFTEHQVYFQCREGQQMESLSVVFPFGRGIVTPPIFPPYYYGEENCDEPDSYDTEPYDPWIKENLLEVYGCITRYAPRKFTHPKDFYDAFLGILQRYENDTIPLIFFAGLPIISPAPNNNQESAQDHTRSGDEEYPAVFKGPSEEMKELAFALSWHFQDNSLSPNQEIVRRAHFPSWTWLGWDNYPNLKLYYFVFDDNWDRGYQTAIKTYHVQSAIIHVAGRQPIPWSPNWQQTCNKLEPQNIDFLEIEGWLVNLTITVQKSAFHKFSVLEEVFFKGIHPERALRVSSNREEALLREFGDKETLEFTGLLLASSCVPEGNLETPWDPWDFLSVFGLLLLKKVEGQSQQETYERFDFANLQFDHDWEEVDEKKEKVEIGPLVFRRTRIWLK